MTADRLVQVLALKSFDQFMAGEYHWVPMSERTANLIVGHYFRLMWDPAWEEVPHDREGED